MHATRYDSGHDRGSDLEVLSERCLKKDILLIEIARNGPTSCLEIIRIGPFKGLDKDKKEHYFVDTCRRVRLEDIHHKL